MPKMKDGDLLDKDYVNHARSAGDDPTKIISDAKRFNRHEKYEVLDFLNALHGQNGADLAIKTRQICEWMIRTYLPGTIQSTKAVESWVAANFEELSKKYPY